MAYELSWHIPGKVMLLSLSGEYSLEDAKAVNLSIMDELARSRVPLMLLIDAAQMARPLNFQELRATQTYMDHGNLKRIVVVAHDRLVKLAMMVIFNLGHAYFSLCDDFAKANTICQRELAMIR